MKILHLFPCYSNVCTFWISINPKQHPRESFHPERSLSSAAAVCCSLSRPTVQYKLVPRSHKLRQQTVFTFQSDTIYKKPLDGFLFKSPPIHFHESAHFFRDLGNSSIGEQYSSEYLQPTNRDGSEISHLTSFQNLFT